MANLLLCLMFSSLHLSFGYQFKLQDKLEISPAHKYPVSVAEGSGVPARTHRSSPNVMRYSAIKCTE